MALLGHWVQHHGAALCAGVATTALCLQGHLHHDKLPRTPPAFRLPATPKECVFFCAHRTGPHAQFSNWFPENTLEAKGHWSPLGSWCWCSEQSFIEAKAHFFGAPDTVAKLVAIDASDDPQISKHRAAEIKQLGRTGIAAFDAAEWDDACFEIMTKTLLAKFEQHESLQRLLLDTGEAYIVESAHYDAKWGIGLRHFASEAGPGAVAADGSWSVRPECWPSDGNLLGRALMATRSILRQRMLLCEYARLSQ